jgi:phage-related protein
MIIFNGVDLTETFPVSIEDITVSPIQLNPVSRQRPLKFGADFIRQGGGTRTVTLSFALLEMDVTERERVMQEIRSWAFSEEEKTLELPQFENRHLECICTQMPDHSYRKWWENKLRLQFTCFNNPFWTSNELIEAPCGETFSIGGSAQPLMTIERKGSSTLRNQVYSTRTEAMTFSTVPAGQLVIDLNRQTAAIGATSIMKYYLNSSTWIVPRIGANQVIYGAGVVKYRERWV